MEEATALDYEDVEAHEDIYGEVDAAWSDEASKIDVSETDLIEEDYEEKHLPAQHDQKKHAGDAITVRSDIIGSRTDTGADWAEIGLKRPTDEELLDVFDMGEAVSIIMSVATFRDEDGDLQIIIRGNDRSIIPDTHFTRKFMIGESGNPIVIHDGFSISPDNRQKGIGSMLLEKSEALYRRMGVKSIHLIANSSVGIYAWARMGFDFGNESSRRPLVDNFYSYLDAHDIPDSEWPQSARHAWEIAAWKSTAKPMYSGKDYLLSDAFSWNAVKYLDDNDEGYKIGQLYYALKRGQKK